MEKIRTDNNSKESGIALVMALVITIVVMMLIGSLTILFTKGFQTNVINRKFSTVYEAASGGAEYGAGIIDYMIDNANRPSDMNPTPAYVSLTAGLSDDIYNLINSANCGGSEQATITAKTADGTYTITTTIKCLGNSGVAGEVTYRFPPLPSAVGGGTGSGSKFYYFYSLISVATETTNPTNIGRTEAIYRAIQ